MEHTGSWRARCRVPGLSAVCLFIVAAVLVSGCGLLGRNGKATQNRTPVKGTVKISGSGTCMPLLKVLAPDFKRVEPDVRLEFLPSVHSSGGIKGTAGGLLDVGAVSRALKAGERKHDLVYHCLSDDALAVAAHRGTGTTSVTTKQLQEVYRGRITNWRQLGGSNLRITVLDRNEDESAKLVLRQYVLGKDLKIAPSAIHLYYEPDMVDGLLGTPGAIGYLSYGLARTRRLDIDILEIDGVEPSVQSVTDGSYKMVRELAVVTKKRPSAAAARYVEYLTSRRAATVMARYGFAPCQGKKED